MQYIVNYTENSQKLIFDDNWKIISKKHINEEKLRLKTPIMQRFQVREYFNHKFKNSIKWDIQYIYTLINFAELNNL